MDVIVISKCINVAVTGYYGTGSSAVIDLLKEYENVKMVPYENMSYEHNLFYHHGGLFDLVSLLTRGNTLYTSDKVINSFLSEMKRLNDYNYVWFGSYKKLFKDEFMDIVENFISSIATIRDDKTTNHIVKVRFSPIKLIAQLALRVLKKRKFSNYGVKYIYDKELAYCALPSKEELYKSARIFTSSYFNLFSKGTLKEVNIFDHVIWPNQIDSFNQCFDENFKIIVVDRDPRDLYVLDQYIWSKTKLRNVKPHFPKEVHSFCEEWKKTLIEKYNSNNVLTVHFEDLVYKYESTKLTIEKFIGLESKSHLYKKEYFDPNASIENTQVFRVEQKWLDDSKKIEEKLPELLYDFPIQRKPKRSMMFVDNSIGKASV